MLLTIIIEPVFGQILETGLLYDEFGDVLGETLEVGDVGAGDERDIESVVGCAAVWKIQAGSHVGRGHGEEEYEEELVLGEHDDPIQNTIPELFPSPSYHRNCRLSESFY